MPSRKSSLCAGWELVCADGRTRHYPYHSLQDAEEDAKLAALDCGLGYEERSPLELSQPPCPGGAHTVVPVAVEHAIQARGQA
jgi:hypothetical protein